MTAGFIAANVLAPALTCGTISYLLTRYALRRWRR